MGKRTLILRDLVSGNLEVALGLETIHPEVLPRLNKRFTLDHFARAAEFLISSNVGLRAFVLVQPPFLRSDSAVEWTVRSAQFAFDCGASVVSLIPTRPGNGALDRLVEIGQFSPPQIRTLEEALDSVLVLQRGRVFADTWDLDRFAACPTCLGPRKSRLERTNLTQEVQPIVKCPGCEAVSPVA